MRTTIRQAVTFAGVPPEEMFDSYLDPTRHAALVGAPVSISDEPGTPFWVFAPNAVRGHTLFVRPHTVIAQSWRGQAWAESDPDSVLTLTFDPDGDGGTQLQLTQAGVPHHAYDIIDSGWRDMYWRPWLAGLVRRHTTVDAATADAST